MYRIRPRFILKLGFGRKKVIWLGWCMEDRVKKHDVSMPPKLLQIMPLYAHTRVEIAQAKGSALVVRVGLENESMEVSFPEKETMAEVVMDIKRWIELAEEHQWTAEGDGWTEAYRQFTQPNKSPVRSNTAPVEEISNALRYVMPLQREDTLAKIQLKRTRTLPASRERKMTLREAKDHWVNAQLMGREDEFVTWEPVTAFVGTWNVHGSLPTREIRHWLIDKGDPDFYSIG
ncbi:hypothetical protein BY458DRAFT_278408 [Sporodiniella umbellata]|nr:hypothetical protein BY458DRAFT_278408 [Sporodiniella umbellata]